MSRELPPLDGIPGCLVTGAIRALREQGEPGPYELRKDNGPIHGRIVPDEYVRAADAELHGDYPARDVATGDECC